MKRNRFIRLFIMALILIILSRCGALSTAAVFHGSNTLVGGAGSIGMKGGGSGGSGGGGGTSPPATQVPDESTGTDTNPSSASPGDNEEGDDISTSIVPKTGDNGILILFVVMALASLWILLFFLSGKKNKR